MSCLNRIKKASSEITYNTPHRNNSSDLGKFNIAGYITPSMIEKTQKNFVEGNFLTSPHSAIDLLDTYMNAVTEISSFISDSQSFATDMNSKNQVGKIASSTNNFFGS